MAHIDGPGTATRANGIKRHQSHLELPGVMLQDSILICLGQREVRSTETEGDKEMLMANIVST